MYNTSRLSRRTLIRRAGQAATGLVVARFGIGCTPGPAPGVSGGSRNGSNTTRPIFDACLRSGEKAARVQRDFASGLSLNVRATPTFFVNGQELRTTQLPTVTDFQTALITNLPNEAINPLLELAEDDHVKGDRNASGTIIEYSEFQCPFCAEFFRTAYADVLATLVDTGLARYVFRHFPLRDIHPNAQAAAEASECAADQGMFFEYHDLLFANQDRLETEDLQRYADELGLR